jgi:hypothetical protein
MLPHGPTESDAVVGFFVRAGICRKILIKPNSSTAPWMSRRCNGFVNKTWDFGRDVNGDRYGLVLEAIAKHCRGKPSGGVSQRGA